MKIVLCGASLNSGNRGVNALTRGTILSIKDVVPDAEINIVSYTVKNTTKNYVDGKQILEIPCNPYDGIRAFIFSVICVILPRILKHKLLMKNKILKEIYVGDFFLDISEGDSFSDIYGIKRFIIHSSLKLSAILLKKKLIIMPETIGPFNNTIVKAVAKFILKHSYSINCRDSISLNLVKNEFNLTNPRISLKPDMAFYMNYLKPIDISKFKQEDEILIGINVSALLYNGGYTRNNMFGLAANYKELNIKIVENILSHQNYKIVLIPHVITEPNHVEDDITACMDLYNYFSKLKDRIFIIDKPYNEMELKGIISQLDFFIGARMHACIAAISTKVPALALAYSRKFIGVWSMFNLSEYAVDLKSMNTEDILQIINKGIENRNLIKDSLDTTMSGVKKEILSLYNSCGIGG